MIQLIHIDTLYQSTIYLQYI